MSFQAYLNSIKTKTGMGPEDFRAMATQKGLTGNALKAGDIVAWLKDDFDIGRGHAMAIYAILKNDVTPRGNATERLDKLFSDAKVKWRPLFETLAEKAAEFGKDITFEPTESYVSLVRSGAKFAVVHPTAARLDLGLKRKGVAPTHRFPAAGTWNSMVTHRTTVSDETDIDAELLEWFREAYMAAG